jgi:hypothetical protein
MRDIKALLKPDLDELRNAGMLERAKGATDLIGSLQEVIGEVSVLRHGALEELTAGEKTAVKDLAKQLGMVPSRLYALLSAGVKTERALFGTGPITVAVGAKVETRPEGTGGEKVPASPVVSLAAGDAYEMIAETVRGYGLKVTREVVLPMSLLNLDRANLVVITSPRLIPIVGLVMQQADKNLGFDRDDDGWFLLDRATGTLYRSPADSGENSDYGYIGRLPRPNSKGSFLYVAGIHAMGTLGATHYLTHHVAELYKQVKTGCWSALVKTSYDADKKITGTELVTPVYLAT